MLAALKRSVRRNHLDTLHIRINELSSMLQTKEAAIVKCKRHILAARRTQQRQAIAMIRRALAHWRKDEVAMAVSEWRCAVDRMTVISERHAEANMLRMLLFSRSLLTFVLDAR